jgi:hypothetical protein
MEQREETTRLSERRMRVRSEQESCLVGANQGYLDRLLDLHLDLHLDPRLDPRLVNSRKLAYQ